jgi:hypothetical protein
MLLSKSVQWCLIIILLTSCEKMSLRMFHSQNKTVSSGSLTNSKIVVDGNSLSNYGSPCFPGESYGSGDKWPTQMMALSPWTSNGATMVNKATSGQNTLQMISGGACSMVDGGTRPAATTFIDSEFDSSKTCILVVWEGGNDLQTYGNVTDAYNRLVSYCNARRSAGFKVLICTLIKWEYYYGATTSFGDTWAQFDTKRLSLNSQITANWASFADGLCDIAANAAFDDPADTTYYHDGIHLNGTGRGVAASVVSTAIQSMSL